MKSKKVTSSKKQVIRIKKEMMMAEIVEKFPEVAEVLAMKYGFHCIGCFASEMETLEQGAMVHGMTKKEVAEMIEELNSRIAA